MWYLFITSPSRIQSHGSYKYGMGYCVNDEITSCYFSDRIEVLFKNLHLYEKPIRLYDIASEFRIQYLIASEHCTVLPIGEVVEDAKALYPEFFI